MARKLDTTILNIVEDGLRNVKSMPLNLGGFGGTGGGVGGRPGGFVGRLPQYLVTYDVTEAATYATLPSGLIGASGWSLVDNLNHIRARIHQLEASGVLIVDDWDGNPTINATNHITFSGAIVTELSPGHALVVVSGGSGGSPLIVDEIDGSPSVSNVNRITVSGATVIDQGGGHVRIAFSGDGQFLRLDTANDPLTDQLQIINAHSGGGGLYLQTYGDAYTADIEQFAYHNEIVSSPVLFLYRGPGDLTNPDYSEFEILSTEDVAGIAISDYGGAYVHKINGDSYIKMAPRASEYNYLFNTVNNQANKKIFAVEHDLTDSFWVIGSGWSYDGRGRHMNEYDWMYQDDANERLYFGHTLNGGHITSEGYGAGYLFQVGAGVGAGNRNIKIFDNLYVDSNLYVNGGQYIDPSKQVTNGDGHDHIGGDGAVITEGALSLSDVTTANASTSAHGFLKKLDNDATHFLDGQGNWSDVNLTGWTPESHTWTYSSADAPTFVLTVNADVTTIIGLGDKIKLTQTSAKYFIVTKISVSSGTTTMTIYGGTDYTLANATITSPYFSHDKSPYGFPLDPSKWTVTLSDTTNAFKNSPTAGTYYNLGVDGGTSSLSISIPIGCWYVDYTVGFQLVVTCTAVRNITMKTALSTSNSSASDAELELSYGVTGTANANTWRFTFKPQRKIISLTSKTTHYLIGLGTLSTDAITSIGFRGDLGATLVKAVCAYL